MAEEKIDKKPKIQIKSIFYICFRFSAPVLLFVFAMLSCKGPDKPLMPSSFERPAPYSIRESEVCVFQRQEVQRMLALGSSSVAGSGASDPAHRFINIIAEKLGVQDLLNLGSGGQRASQVLGALADQARDYHADILVVMAFSDYAYSDGATMIENWRQILQPMAADGTQIYFGDLRIDPAWVCSEVPTPNGECYDLSTAEMLNEKNRLAEQVLAPIEGVHIVGVDDVNAAHPEWILPDGHFNDAGHAHLAQVFLQVIEADFLTTNCPEDGGS